MNRRSFIKSVLAGTFGVALDPKVLAPYTPKLASDKLYPSLLGIPYHQSNAGMGEWLGIRRQSAYAEIQALINLIEKDKQDMR